jgi:hypothetical protein
VREYTVGTVYVEKKRKTLKKLIVRKGGGVEEKGGSGDGSPGKWSNAEKKVNQFKYMANKPNRDETTKAEAT